MKAAAIIACLVIAAALIGLGAYLWTPDKSRAELEAKYLAAPGDMLDVAGLRLHVRDSGPRGAPAVILLHGFGSSLHTWEPWTEALAAEYRVVSLDLPGFGLTGPDPTGDYSNRRSIDVLAALMDQLGLPKASLVGHSMGGKLAWSFAAAHPERVDKLVLISPDGFASSGRDYGKRADAPPLARLMRYVLPKPLLRMNLAAAYADPAALTDAVVTRYHDLILAPGVRDAILSRMGQDPLADPAPALRSIAAPTLLVWGEKDAMIPVAHADDYLRALAGAELVSFPGVGHIPHEEAPAASIAPVKAFLAG